MTWKEHTLQRRRWADVVILLSGIYAFLVAAFSPQLAGPTEARQVVANAGWWWAGTGVGGALAIAAVLLALRSTAIARLCGALAGALILSTLFTFERIGWLAIVTVIVPGVLLLVATPFVGPMPSPEEEGKER